MRRQESHKIIMKPIIWAFMADIQLQSSWLEQKCNIPKGVLVFCNSPLLQKMKTPLKLCIKHLIIHDLEASSKDPLFQDFPLIWLIQAIPNCMKSDKDLNPNRIHRFHFQGDGCNDKLENGGIESFFFCLTESRNAVSIGNND